MSFDPVTKRIAYKIDPEAFISYSGAPKAHKQAMDRRRTAALEMAKVVRRKSSKRRLPGYGPWLASSTMRAVLMQRNFDETGIEYLRRKAEAEGLSTHDYAMLAYCAALSQGRSEWR